MVYRKLESASYKGLLADIAIIIDNAKVTLCKGCERLGVVMRVVCKSLTIDTGECKVLHKSSKLSTAATGCFGTC